MVRLVISCHLILWSSGSECRFQLFSPVEYGGARFEMVHLSFPEMFSLNSLNSATNIFVITVKGLKCGTQPHLV